jgi:hypothetical protein
MYHKKDEFIRVDRGTAATNPKFKESHGLTKCSCCHEKIPEGHSFYIQYALKDNHPDYEFKQILCTKQSCLDSGLIYFDAFDS